MKKILLFIGILLSFTANSQTWNTVTTGSKFTYSKFLGVLGSDSGNIIGSVSSLANCHLSSTFGSLVTFGDSLYFRSTSKWINLSKAAGTPANAFVQNGNSFGATANLGTNDNYDLNLKANNSTKIVVGRDGTVYSPTYNWSFNTDYSFQLGSDAGFNGLGYLRIPNKGYMNFSTSDANMGSSGFGFRDSAGLVQFKDSLGSWNRFASASSIGNTIYTGDGTLSSNRIINGKTKNITFDSIGNFFLNITGNNAFALFRNANGGSYLSSYSENSVSGNTIFNVRNPFGSHYTDNGFSVIYPNQNSSDGYIQFAANGGFGKLVYYSSLSNGRTDTIATRRYADSVVAASNPILTLQDITDNGYTTTDSIIAASFKRTGGTASQFLKANGSVDNNTYLNKADSIAGGYYPYSSNPKAYLTSASLTGYVPYSTYGTNNVSANNYFDGFTSVAASGTLITLTVNSTPSYLVTGSGGQTIKLPDATTLPNGALFNFNNNQSSGAILINNNSNTLVKSVPSGGNIIIELIDNSISAGSWDAHSQAPSNVSWSTNTFDYAGSITSATWNGVNVALNRGGTGANTAAGARTNLGSTTVGDNFFTLTNPSAKRFTQINADNTVSTLDSNAFRAAIGAGTSNANGTVTSVSRTNGLGILASVANSTTTPNITIAVDTSDVSILSRQRAAATYQTTNTTLTNGRGITGSPYNGSTARTFGLDTTQPYTWTGSNTFSNQTTTFSQNASNINTTLVVNSNVNAAQIIRWTSGGSINSGSFLATGNAYTYGTYPSNQVNLIGGTGGIALRTDNAAPIRLYATNVSADFSTVQMQMFASTGNIALQNGGTYTDAGDRLQVAGNLNLTTAGNKLKIATGTNASAGIATLSAGTVTVSTTAVTANSIIMLTSQSCSNCAHVYISAKTAATSFVITSINILDASIIGWQIIN